jgi:O-antigen biosynthesis protein
MRLHYAAARAAGWWRPVRPPNAAAQAPAANLEPGISVVIPSRNGRELLAAQLPGIVRDLAAGEIIVVDNGSRDGTAQWLDERWPRVLVEISSEPLSFARAVNRGIARARSRLICLLNNDMLLEPGFFAALGHAFERVPGLFCATAQIRFPPGVRREETGKAVMAQTGPRDFPIRCDEPFPGEDLTYVLYGSGGCSAYDAVKLRELGALDEIYTPAYMEDLDVGYRAWLRGWPSVYVAGALVEHRHRATTSRYYTQEQLDAMFEVNYLRFLARAVANRRIFRRLWLRALRRLRSLATPAARSALRAAAGIALAGGPPPAPAEAEELLLALSDGSVACFPGRAPAGRTCTVVACSSLWEALRVPAPDGGRILVALVDRLETPPADLLACYGEITLVRGRAVGADMPLAFRAAVWQAERKWGCRHTEGVRPV